ncbi:MAG TPA: DMT family transporter [Acidimicrobiales bacterium]|nr:DMT family transporter [Acidimicrobiales bacterium]
MPVLFALLTAFSNAVNVVTQHKASISAPKRSKGWRFAIYLFRNPLWLFGWVALVAAFVFQALALHNGPISVVQPLLVSELVFALVLRWLWIHQAIKPVTWWSAGVTCAALAAFIAVAEPSGGSTVPTSRVWVSAAAAIVGCVAVTAALGWFWRGSAGRRAALLGASASMLWAFVATLIKATTDTLTQFGVSGMFTHWPVYALAAAGLTAEILNQVALHVGPLSVSQPFIVIVDPIVSIALSVWIYGETFSPNAARLAIGAMSFAAMCGAVVVLTRTAPATMDPDRTPVPAG